MNSVISKLQELTNSDKSTLQELIDIFAVKYPKKDITLLALKNFAFNDKAMNEQSILDILAQIH